MDEKICHKCHTVFSLDENTQGIVVNDRFFICEDCHSKQMDDDESEDFSSSKQIVNNEMPIALWLIKEQNKGKSFMSKKN